MIFGDEKENYRGKKSLIIYFSRADENYGVGYIEKGNTEVVAEFIKEITGGDLFQVEAKNPYAKDYDTCINEAKQRQSSHDAPIIQSVPSIEGYEVIYIGAPVYWGVMPEEMVTALKNLDFSGKVVRVFTTHEGSGTGSIPSQVKNICMNATVLDDALAVRGSSVLESRSRVEEWI